MSYSSKIHAVVWECFAYGMNKNLITLLGLFRKYIQFLPRFILVPFLKNKFRQMYVLKPPIKINASATYIWKNLVFKKGQQMVLSQILTKGEQWGAVLWEHTKNQVVPESLSPVGKSQLSLFPPGKMHGSCFVQLNRKDSSSLIYFFFFIFCCISCSGEEDDI